LADPERLIPRVYSYVDYIVGDDADAQSITRRAIERAFRNRDTYNPRRGSPLTWVFGIARSCVADRFQEPFPTIGNPVDELPESEALFDPSDTAAIRAGVAKLGPLDRELVALRYGADLSAREIAEQLGLSTTAVSASLEHAHGRLRAIL